MFFSFIILHYYIILQGFLLTVLIDQLIDENVK